MTDYINGSWFGESSISRNQIITLNRGDTFSAPLCIECGDRLNPEHYVLGDGDSVYFGVMEANQPFEFALIKKRYTSEDLDEDGNVVISLESKDTQFLLPGTYYYQAKIEHKAEGEDDVIATLMTKRKLFLIA